jgi:hypothetical protein
MRRGCCCSLQWLPERADAEDAVQIGFVKFWRNRPRPTAADVPLLFAAGGHAHDLEARHRNAMTTAPARPDVTAL